MTLLIECVIGIVLFTVIAVPQTARDPLGVIGDYPPEIRQRCIELRLIKPCAFRFTKAELVRKIVAVAVLATVLALVLIHFNGAQTFQQGFLDAYIIWLAITWWDALVCDCLWFCHSKRIRIPGTEDMPQYHDYLFHIRQSLIGSAIGLPVCALVGLIVMAA